MTFKINYTVGRERERQTETETDRQRQRQTETEMERGRNAVRRHTETGVEREGRGGEVIGGRHKNQVTTDPPDPYKTSIPC